MNNQKAQVCQSASCSCRNTISRPKRGLARRDFLRLLGTSSVGAAVVNPTDFLMAGPFTRSDFDRLVPADKKLSPEWLRSLFDRGTPTVYRKSRQELEYIGMPTGGICAGQLYLGGDGRLWHWDIFNDHLRTGAEHYVHPLSPKAPVDQGFVLLLKTSDGPQARRLMAESWDEVTFNGEYPIGTISYSDPHCPMQVKMQAYSPFIPLEVDSSSLPATVFEFTLHNTGSVPLEVTLAGWLENATCINSSKRRRGLRRNDLVQDRQNHCSVLHCTAGPLETGEKSRPDIVFDDFERETYGDWRVTGDAFGNGPVQETSMPPYQGAIGAKGKRLVNTHASAPGKDSGERDTATGSLTSKVFSIQRDYITFLLGGGNHKGKTAIQLTVDDQVVLTSSGTNQNKLEPVTWDVRPWAGRSAKIVILDQEKGPWGNVGVDEIVFTDNPEHLSGPLGDEADFGSMAFALLNAKRGDRAFASLPVDMLTRQTAFTNGPEGPGTATRGFGEKLVGGLSRRFKVAPGKSESVTFVLSWCLPNLEISNRLKGRFYGTQFKDARGVVRHIARNFKTLSTGTKLWRETWYDSTLPYWFLDRTFLNTSILATSTCYRFGDGRFYGWEGVGCCEGTCGHVWQYAHAVARLFPELERFVREKVDLGLAQQPDGAIHFRGEFNDIPAIDAQAGVVLRALREHQMSPDNRFLVRNWAHIKSAIEWLIKKDANQDGIIESNQHNTLDTDWFGPVAWLSGLYLSALVAGREMAIELGDAEFAGKCRSIYERGRAKIVSELFDGEYFINQVDPAHLDAINSGTGCEIDQVLGQSWAFQVGLPRVLPEKETKAALASIWRYNFTPDVGPYRNAYKAGRWYAVAGEAGLLMCSFPRSDWDYAQAKGKGPEWAAGYFNECMNGFEYQVAGHMLWEGMLTEGMAITRAVHDRYHAARRNPWNEVECGDHYARSMASYGIYLAACGFEYHGPKGHIGFAPRIHPDTFKAAFTAAEGWGTFTQQREARSQTHSIKVHHGLLNFRSFSFELPEGATLVSATARRGTRLAFKAQALQKGRRVELSLTDSVQITARDKEAFEINATFS